MSALSLPIAANPLLSASSDPDNIRVSSASALLAAARKQIGVTTVYDPAYVRLDYPGGDVPTDRGVCIDVIIRAYRSALDFDFQKAIHEDMASSFALYPKIWGLTRPDKNIDHRRVPNLETWLAREDAELANTDWQPGDLMTCRLPGNLPHVAIVSQPAPAGTLILRVVHNIGLGTREEPVLLTGLKGIRHFRFTPENANA